MLAGVKIYGGFNGTLSGAPDTPPFFGAAGRDGISTLSGNIGLKETNDDNAFHVVMASGNMGSAILDGFTVSDGYSPNSDGGSITVNNNTFIRNDGAGVASISSMTFTNLKVINNRGYTGGGMYLSGAGSVLTNVVIAENSADYGGGIYIAGSGTHNLTNITIADNVGDEGGAIFIYYNSTLNLRNSIVWGNTNTSGTADCIYLGYYGRINHAHNLMQGVTLITGSTEIVANTDPLFISDYMLQSGSPAIDMGDKTLFDVGKNPDISDIITDLRGAPRIQGANVDLGPYETVSIVPTAGMIYVIEGGAGKQDGSSWDDAYPNLAYPLRMAKICGVKAIWVAEGNYYPMFAPTTNVERDKTFLMAEDVKIYGGFNGNLTGAPTVPQTFGFDGRKGVSVLNGDIDKDGIPNSGNALHVVMSSGDMGNALLEGFTISGGYSSDADAGSIVVNNNIVTKYDGAGIAANGSMTFVNLTIRNNTGYNGGGIHLSGNGADGAGSVFTNIVLADNIAQHYGGGTYMTEGPHYMTNLTVSNNRGEEGGAVYIYSGVLNLRNSIAWGNTKKNGITHDNIVKGANGFVNHHYNLLQDETLTPGLIVVNSDPLFIDADNGDYSLDPESPAIDMGDKTVFNPGEYPEISAVIADIVGESRIGGIDIDLGAYEVNKILIIVRNDTAKTTSSKPVTIDVLLNDDYGVCLGLTLVFDTVAGGSPRNGVLEITNDNTFVYLPNPGHLGIDSIDYMVSCSGKSGSARVYVLTHDPLSKEYYACPGTQIVVGFEEVPYLSYDWYDDDPSINPPFLSSSYTMTVTKNDGLQTYYARPSWKGMEFTVDTVKLYPSQDSKPEARDIRVMLCPSPARNIHLSAFLDSLDYASPIEWMPSSDFLDISSGVINTGDFHNLNVHTYRYIRRSECLTSYSTAKAYVYISNDKIPPRPDTILVCTKHAQKLNLNSIIGLEYDGFLRYDNSVNPDNVVSDNVTEIVSPSQLAGMLMFDVQTAHNQATNSKYNVNYHGISGKQFAFDYVHTTSDCDAGTTRIVIISYE
jgi:hypothetical protein